MAAKFSKGSNKQIHFTQHKTPEISATQTFKSNIKAHTAALSVKVRYCFLKNKLAKPLVDRYVELKN